MEVTQKRWSSRKKTEIVLRLLRGELIDTVSRENEVTVGMLSQWRDDFIASGIAGLKGRSIEDVRAADMEKKIGQQAMEIELYKKKVQWQHHLQGTRHGSS
jgi:transposase-like protein